MPKAATRRATRGNGGVGGASRDCGRSAASAASGTGRRGVAGKSQSKPREGGSTHFAVWNKFFKLLEDFKEANGHLNVPQRSGPLGGWVLYQRQLKRKRKLAPDRVDRLTDIGFNWGSSYEERCEKKSDEWNEKFKQLAEYRRAYGHCNVPHRGHGTLGIWVSNLRRSKKGNWTATLTEERIELLNDIGFVWNLPRGRKRKATRVSDEENVVPGNELRADEGAPERAANYREDPPASHTLNEADGPSEQGPRAESERRRRRKRRRSISVANPSKDGRGRKSKANESNESSFQNGVDNEAEFREAEESQHGNRLTGLGRADDAGATAWGSLNENHFMESEESLFGTTDGNGDQSIAAMPSTSREPNNDAGPRDVHNRDPAADESDAEMEDIDTTRSNYGHDLAEESGMSEPNGDGSRTSEGNNDQFTAASMLVRMAAMPTSREQNDSVDPLTPIHFRGHNPVGTGNDVDSLLPQPSTQNSGAAASEQTSDENQVAESEQSLLNLSGGDVHQATTEIPSAPARNDDAGPPFAHANANVDDTPVLERDESNHDDATPFGQSDVIDAVESRGKRAAMLTLSALFVFVAVGLITSSSVIGISPVTEPLMIGRQVNLVGKGATIIEKKKETNYSSGAGLIHDDEEASAPGSVSTTNAVALRANDNLQRDGISSFDVPWHVSSKISSVKYEKKSRWSYAVSFGSKFLIDEPRTQRRWLSSYKPLIDYHLAIRPTVEALVVRPLEEHSDSSVQELSSEQRWPSSLSEKKPYQAEAPVAILPSPPSEIQLHTVVVDNGANDNESANDNEKVSEVMAIDLAGDGADDTRVQEDTPGMPSAAKSMPEEDTTEVLDAVDGKHNEPVSTSDHLIADEGACFAASEDRDVTPGEEGDSIGQSGKMYCYNMENGGNSCDKPAEEANNEFVNKKEKNYSRVKDDEQHDVSHDVLPGDTPGVERGEQREDLHGELAGDHQGEHDGIAHDGHNEHVDIPSLQGFHKSEGAPATDEGSSYASTDHDRDEMPDGSQRQSRAPNAGKEYDSSRQSSGSRPPSAAWGKGYSNKQKSRENSQARSDVGENDGFFADGKGADEYEDSKSDQPLFGSPILKEIWRLLSQASSLDVLIILCCGSMLFVILSTALFHGRAPVQFILYSPQSQFVHQGSINYGQAASETPQQLSSRCAVDAFQCESTDPTAPTEVSQFHSNQRSSTKESEQKRETDSQRQRRERMEKNERNKGLKAQLAIEAVTKARELQKRRENKAQSVTKKDVTNLEGGSSRGEEKISRSTDNPASKKSGCKEEQFEVSEAKQKKENEHEGFIRLYPQQYMMFKAGVPEGAVRNSLIAEGVVESEVGEIAEELRCIKERRTENERRVDCSEAVSV